MLTNPNRLFMLLFSSSMLLCYERIDPGFVGRVSAWSRNGQALEENVVSLNMAWPPKSAQCRSCSAQSSQPGCGRRPSCPKLPGDLMCRFRKQKAAHAVAAMWPLMLCGPWLIWPGSLLASLAAAPSGRRRRCCPRPARVPVPPRSRLLSKDDLVGSGL